MNPLIRKKMEVAKDDITRTHINMHSREFSISFRSRKNVSQDGDGTFLIRKLYRGTPSRC